ncbi:MAG: T9SS type A sorting domain-containing protein [Bacteroidales bacterium]|nr:T9SS type A sorting domain-containing protein [Bacteroidales bacterium]
MITFTHTQITICRRYRQLRLIVWLCMCFFWLASASVASAQTPCTYQKSLGKSGKQMKNPIGGYTMQAAHEDWNVIYCNRGTITLRRNRQAFFTYARWYNYANDSAIANFQSLRDKSELYSTQSNGVIWYASAGSAADNADDATFMYNGGTVYIACDQSSYLDGGPEPNGTDFYEPTIEQRIVYEIREAQEMATLIGNNAETKWLEEYDITAPTGQTIYLGPKYAFQSDNSMQYKPYPSYFYYDGQYQDMGSSGFSTSNNTFTEGTWVWSNPSSTTKKTVYECIETYNYNGQWDFLASQFSSTSGQVVVSGLTWNYTRTSYNGGTLAPPENTIYNNENYVCFGGPTSNSAETLVLSTDIPDGLVVTKISVTCYCNNSRWGILGYFFPHTLNISINKNQGENITNGAGNSGNSLSLTNSPKTYYTTPLSEQANSIQITFSSNAGQRALYINKIEIEYENGTSSTIGTISKDVPSDFEAKFWQKIDTIFQSGDREKTNSLQSNSRGWIWMEDNKQVSNPSISSGQYIKVNEVSQPTKKTYELLYSTNYSQRDITYNQTGVSSQTINKYAYNSSTSEWDDLRDSFLKESIGNETTTIKQNGGVGKIYHIAQFRVNFVDKAVVGPATQMNSFLANMEVIAEQNFNFGHNAQNRLPKTKTLYPTPLDVGESSYGFYYGTEHRLSGNLQNCYFNEYSFVNNGFGYTLNSKMANHTGTGQTTDATTGFALYTDGSQRAGTIFSLDFGAELCPGAKMFFSAWIGDQNKSDYYKSINYASHPIFTFYVEGFDKDNHSTILATFTTGEFNETNEGWHHILFPVEFKEDIDYERFKLRIVNMSANIYGNDFFIDDIRVYLQRASISPIQASTPKDVCLNEQEKMVLYTRIDYKELDEFLQKNGRKFYYRWYDMNGNPVTTAAYLPPQTSTDNIPYGEITVPYLAADLSGDEHTYASFDDFDEAKRTSTTPAFAYILEDCLQPDNTTEQRYVVYIATPVPVLFGQNYRCVVAYAAEDLPQQAAAIDLGNKCLEDAIVKTVNGLCIHSTQLGGFMADDSQASANLSYSLAMVSEGMVRNGALSSKEVTYYYAHWLYGREPDKKDPEYGKKSAALAELYGESYDNVKAAIQAYIQHVTLGVATAPCTDEQKALVDRLVQARLLKLSNTQLMSDTSYTVYPLLTVDSINYTAFPIQSIYGEESACKEPKAITLFFEKDDEGGEPTVPERNAICFVSSPTEKTPPDFVLSQPRRVRILADTAKQEVFITLTNTNRLYTLQSAMLWETTNGNINIKQPPFNHLHWIDDSQKSFTGKPASGHKVKFSHLDDLPEGYSYTFLIDFAVHKTENKDTVKVDDGKAYITFVVVPDTLYYAGALGDAWNADAKWQRRDENGKNVQAVVPLPETKVIYPQTNPQVDYVVKAPTSTSSKQQAANTQLEDNAQAFITYDINYAPYSCSEVYIPANTAVVGQQYLKHNAEVPLWTIELPVWANKWKMNAIPLQGVVLGDMFIPASGSEDADNPFEVKPISQDVGYPAYDRTTYSFYNSLYNSDVRQYNENGSFANISSSTWSFATNELDKPVPAGYGWALGYAGTNTNTTIRLPKPNTKYNYFKDGVWVTFSSSDIDRKNAGKPMFTPDSEGEMTITLRNNSASEIFLFGNPTFAYIDLKKLMKAYAYNDAVATDSIKIAGFYTTGVDKDSRYQLAAKTGGAEGWVSSVKSAGSVSDTSALLAPTEAVFIRFENAKNPSVVPSLTKVTLTLSTSMLCDKEGKYYGDGTIKPSSANAPAAQPEQALYITASRSGFMSSAVIVEDTTVEAEIFMLDKAKTPFAIFTVGNNRALAINHPRGEEHIPLALYAAAEVEQPTITFDGDPSYVMKWDLIDVKTGLREPLLAGRTMTLDLPLNGEVRYYLERTQRESVIVGDTTEAFRLFAYCGQLIIYSEEPLYDLRVYDPTGRLIAASADAGNSFAIVLPAGTYIVRASGSTAKVIVH